MDKIKTRQRQAGEEYPKEFHNSDGLPLASWSRPTQGAVPRGQRRLYEFPMIGGQTTLWDGLQNADGVRAVYQGKDPSIYDILYHNHWAKNGQWLDRGFFTKAQLIHRWQPGNNTTTTPQATPSAPVQATGGASTKPLTAPSRAQPPPNAPRAPAAMLKPGMLAAPPTHIRPSLGTPGYTASPGGGQTGGQGQQVNPAAGRVAGTVNTRGAGTGVQGGGAPAIGTTPAGTMAAKITPTGTRPPGAPGKGNMARGAPGKVSIGKGQGKAVKAARGTTKAKGGIGRSSSSSSSGSGSGNSRNSIARSAT